MKPPGVVRLGEPGGLTSRTLRAGAWASQRIGRATQALPNGYFGLPVVKHARTPTRDLPDVRHHPAVPAPAPLAASQVIQIISAAEARGQQRLAEMNRQVLGNLEQIIAALETRGDTGAAGAADAR